MLIKQSQLRQIPDQRDWQVRAWDYFDVVGELRFAVQWISNALSRCRLYVGMTDDDGGAPDPIGVDNDASSADDRARIPLQELFGGPAGQSGMLSRLAMHLTVPGESYLIAFDDIDTAQRRWMVASSEEFVRSGSAVKVRLPESDRLMPIKLEESTVIRLWRQHPRRAWEADSPVRAALSVLKELVDLSAHISATVESRLAGAGLLLLPESASLPAPLGQAGGEALHEDPAMATLIDAMVTPIGDRDSAAAVVPIIVRIPDTASGKAEWLTFSTPFDQKIMELREASIRRFATIVDIPAEVLVGFAEANRWNSWKISEDAIKLHIEPLLALICDALTTQYLWPALEAMGVADPQRYTIWYDAIDLVLRPNRGPESENLHQAGLVGGKTVRRANGFTEDDAPDEEEFRRMLVTQLAEKGIDPILVAPYLRELGIELQLPEEFVTDQWDPSVQPENVEPGTAPAGSRIRGRPPNDPHNETRPERLPANPDTVDRTETRPFVAALHPPANFAAIELGALRALELAGKRMLNGTNREWKGKLHGIDPWEIHTHIPAAGNSEKLLAGAYALLETCLPDQPCVYDVIDTYVRERLRTQQPHDPACLLTMLAAGGCLAGGSRAIA